MRGFKEHEECCGTCKYHKYEDIDGGWVCVNPNSEYCTDYTSYKDCCEEYKKKIAMLTDKDIK